MVKHKLPLFYQDLLQHWFSFKNLHRKIPHNFREIRMQVLWGNQFIKLSGQNKTLIFHNWIESGIYFLNDILDVNGKISHNIVLPKLLKKQNWIAELNSIINAIPSAWKSTITNRESILSKVKTILTPLDDRFTKFTNKDLYQYLLRQHENKTYTERMWETKFGIEPYMWNQLYTNIYNCCPDNRIKQFK